MFNISSFLEKFTKSINSAELCKQQILDIIEKHTQIKLSPEDVEVKDYIIYINSSPAVKNKLFIYKTNILKEISETLPVKVIDLR